MLMASAVTSARQAFTATTAAETKSAYRAATQKVSTAPWPKEGLEAGCRTSTPTSRATWRATTASARGRASPEEAFLQPTARKSSARPTAPRKRKESTKTRLRPRRRSQNTEETRSSSSCRTTLSANSMSLTRARRSLRKSRKGCRPKPQRTRNRFRPCQNLITLPNQQRSQMRGPRN